MAKTRMEASRLYDLGNRADRSRRELYSSKGEEPNGGLMSSLMMCFLRETVVAMLGVVAWGRFVVVINIPGFPFETSVRVIKGTWNLISNVENHHCFSPSACCIYLELWLVGTGA